MPDVGARPGCAFVPPVTRSAAFHSTTDVFAESTYVAYQGQPSGWKAVFEALAARYPKLAIAEYNREAVTTPAGTTSVQQAKRDRPEPPERRRDRDVLLGADALRRVG